ncbi:hypothetical protein EOM86_10175 [Candidatus Nomurabacteria bacterium]|nr:hypothetical protein [Candidatus Nomurabacteria bacterium]
MTEDELGVKKVKVRNYMSRWFLKRNRLAVFSPDYMVGRLHDPQPIEKIERVFSTIPKTDVGDSDYSGEWSHDNINDGFSDIYPRWTKAEMEGIVESDPLEANDITVFSVGDESNNYPQSPSGEFVNYMKDFFTSDIETMFYGLSNNQNRVYTNRGVATPKYIGVNINEELSDQAYMVVDNKKTRYVSYQEARGMFTSSSRQKDTLIIWLDGVNSKIAFNKKERLFYSEFKAKQLVYLLHSTHQNNPGNEDNMQKSFDELPESPDLTNIRVRSAIKNIRKLLLDLYPDLDIIITSRQPTLKGYYYNGKVPYQIICRSEEAMDLYL